MELLPTVKGMMKDCRLFITQGSRLKLRKYQEIAALSIINSVVQRKGLTFVVIFPRQSGKNELQAQIESYLMTLYLLKDAEIVKVSPTYKPQTLNAMRRLQRVLERNMITREMWSKESGYIYKIGNARMFFLSGSPQANVVGATANLLLECDEAQDISIEKWDKDFAPMAASTNATRVFWGTMWTSKTLLIREMRAALAAEAVDGIKRVFKIDASDVAKEVPAYKKFVEEQVAKLGREHPLIKTQYFSEQIDSEGGMFPDRRMAMMQGTHQRQIKPVVGILNYKEYALLIDVAGEDEGAMGDNINIGELELSNKGRDSTTATVVEIDLASVADEMIRLPTYRIVERYSWIGVKHFVLYGQIKALADMWRIKHLVIDATGVGAGLASFLAKSLGEKVIPYTFNTSTKSKLGWAFLGMIESGRLKDYMETEDKRLEFLLQCKHCQMEIIEGPDRRMKWGVPDSTRSTVDGKLVHDDWILSAALAAVLDELDWSISAEPIIMKRRDPLLEMDREGF